ncbi:MAG: hypothetical protein N2117_10545 [Anaerolineales bacterium]|nr:hypothetical protein [Anaerolineales bacterium]MCX7755664.1 hypothetical protein [Anaerolineales bacterium]MDW8279468.1 hypothetical protein [Anaerolineales bacterium]
MNALSELHLHLDRWIRWRRTRRGLTWGVRGLSLGLLLALLWGLTGTLQGWFVESEFAAFVTLVSLGVATLTSMGAALWPLPRLQAARDFDRAFHLQERISTALELHAMPTLVPEELRRRQLKDAVDAARRVNPQRSLPLRIRPLEALLPFVLIGLILFGYAQSKSFFQETQRARAVEQVIQEQSERLEELLKEVEINPALSEEQKKALSAPLQQALQELKQNPTQEGAVSVLVKTGEQLQALSAPQAEKTLQALEQTGQELAAQEDTPLQAVGEQLKNGNPIHAAAELAKIDPSQLSSQETRQLTQQLQQMAQAVQENNPQLAQQLNQAAQALQSGNAAAAQQALQQAAQTITQASQQQIMNQAARQAAAQVQQCTGQVLAAGGGNTPGQATSSAGQSSQGNAAAGSGKGTGENPNAQAGEAGSSSNSPNNQPGDGGEKTYEQIYAPSLLGGEGGPQVGLNSGQGEGGQVIGQSPSAPIDSGQSLVPYTEVLGQYEELNRRAIESGQIPLEFTQIIRRYFDSLK